MLSSADVPVAARMRGSLLLVFPSLILLGLAGSQAGAQKHVVQPADLAGLKSLERPRVSPDGRRVAYTVRTPTPAGKPRQEHIWVAATDRPGTARPFVSSASADTAPDWSPDGRYLAFLSNRSNPLLTPDGDFKFAVAPGSSRPDLPAALALPASPARHSEATVPKSPQGPNQNDPGKKPGDTTTPEPATPKQQVEQQAPPTPATPPDPSAPPDSTADDLQSSQLWWIPVDGGEAQPLTALGGNIRAFRWSHDGKHIAFIRTDAETPAERARKNRKDDREIIDHEYHFDRLWVLDLETHQARLLTHADENVDTLDWSPDDTAIVSRVSPTPRLDDYWRVSQVKIYAASDGAVRQVVEANSGYQEPVYSQDGLKVAYSRFTPRRITDVHLVRTLATGQDLRLEDTLAGTLAEVRWISGDRLLVNAYVNAHTEAHILDTATGNATALPALPPTALDFHATPDGTTVVFLGQTPAQPEEVSVWRKDGVQVLTATHPQVQNWLLGSEQEVSWKSSKDGHTIYGVLSLPPGYKAGQRYPAVIHLHGGPEEAFTVGFNSNWYNYAALLASQGYVVLQPNYRGSAGQDIAFTEANYRDWGGGDFADLMSGLDWLEAQGYADPNRVAIAGWSYGGYLTSWSVTHTDRFKAAMAGAAVTDVFSMSTTTDIAPSYLNSYLGPPAGNAAEYDRHSPVRFSQACHTPVLVLHGQADHRVPLTQGQEFYNALHFNGQVAEMVTYPREAHIFSEPEHQIDSLTRELAWFARYMGEPKAR